MPKKDLTKAIAVELQKPEFTPFLEEWIANEIRLTLNSAGDNESVAERIIELGKLRELVAKQKKG